MKVINKGKVPVFSWCENPESSAIDQAVNASNHPCTFHHVAMMPDAHSGYGLPVGGVMALTQAVSPYAVGVDIACGMMSIPTTLHSEEISKTTLHTIIAQIRRDVPMGCNHNKDNVFIDEAKKIVDTYFEIVD